MTFLRLLNSSFLKTWDFLNRPFFLKFLFSGWDAVMEYERFACLECGREYTRKDASKHRKHCGVFKFSNCNFYTYSSKELTNHIIKKYYFCEHNDKLCAQQSQNTLQEKVKLI